MRAAPLVHGQLVYEGSNVDRKFPEHDLAGIGHLLCVLAWVLLHRGSHMHICMCLFLTDTWDTLPLQTGWSMRWKQKAQTTCTHQMRSSLGQCFTQPTWWPLPWPCSSRRVLRCSCACGQRCSGCSPTC